jgi:hypothetical protein
MRLSYTNNNNNNIINNNKYLRGLGISRFPRKSKIQTRPLVGEGATK